MLNVKIKLERQTQTEPGAFQLYMHKEDKDTDIFDGGVRGCALGGCPAVFVLKEPRLKTKMTKEWQFYLRAINYNMTVENVYLLLDDQLAFSNFTGFHTLDNPGRKDYFFNRTRFEEYPKLDKDRTCSRNLLAGVEVGDKLNLALFNGNQPPPLKPGRSYPQTLEQINIDDYLFNPKDHRWMFIVANRVTTKPGNTTSVAPFPRGAQYDWTGDNLNYSFVPHVSTEEILYPLKYLVKLDMSKPLPSPYRIVTT